MGCKKKKRSKCAFYSKIPKVCVLKRKWYSIRTALTAVSKNVFIEDRIMRKPVVMGNWKLNGTKSTVTDLIKAFREPADKNANVDVAICAPAIFIGMVESLATGSSLKWGSED